MGSPRVAGGGLGRSPERQMKVDFTDVSDIRKRVAVEVPSTTVDREIERLSQRYRRSVRIPGFRPGKAPARLVLQRMREQILQEAAQNLVPKAVDDLLRERDIRPVDTPDIHDVSVDEGRPLTFTATFETLPEVDAGEYDGLTLRRKPIEVTDANIDEALEQLRGRAAREEPVDGRGAAHGDLVTVDAERRVLRRPDGETGPPPAPERRSGARIEIGAADNPPGFDAHLVGLEAGATTRFTVTEPGGAEVEFDVRVTAIHERVLPDLDDDFARAVGSLESLADLRAQAAADLRAHAEREADRRLRDELLTQLAGRMPGDVPEGLVNRELDRRLERLARELLAQRIDPQQTNIDWNELREGQRPAAVDTVKSALVLDAIAGREQIEATKDEIDKEIERLAERANRGAQAMRAILEKDDGVASLALGMRREKTIQHLLSHATIVEA